MNRIICRKDWSWSVNKINSWLPRQSHVEHFFLYKFIYVVLKRPDSNFLLIIPAVIVYSTVLENGVFRLFCTYFFCFHEIIMLHWTESPKWFIHIAGSWFWELSWTYMWLLFVAWASHSSASLWVGAYWERVSCKLVFQEYRVEVTRLLMVEPQKNHEGTSSTSC